MSALGLVLAIAAVQPAAPYVAHGTEPFWDVTIAGGRIVDRSAEGARVAARTPPRRAIRNGYRYVTPRFRIDVTHVRCGDGMGDRVYADTFRISFPGGGPPLDGCGGAVLPPERLAGTDWSIVAIGGGAVSGVSYQLGFGEDGRLYGRAGCNRFSGPYSEAGRVLTPGPLAATRMACPGPAMDHERRVMAVLGGPAMMRYLDGDTLMLSGHGGTIRLRRQ
jgi:heat shock protein HslJ/uncharacterized membrane protein